MCIFYSQALGNQDYYTFMIKDNQNNINNLVKNNSLIVLIIVCLLLFTFIQN